MPQYVLSGDIGSGSCKTALVTTEGEVVTTSQKEYANYYPKPGWIEQHPEDWYRAFCTTVKEIIRSEAIDTGDIKGVGIVGVTHNFVLLDEADRSLCPSMLMFDTRSVEQATRINEKWKDEIFKRTINDLNSAWSWPQLLWIKENCPDTWKKVRKILFPKDYVRHRFAPSYLTDYIDASGTSLFDPFLKEWIFDFCDDLGLSETTLPRVVEPSDVISSVSRTGAEDTGLKRCTPVIAGSSDTVAEVLGAGAVLRGKGTVKLASVGRIAVVSDGPIFRRHVFNYRHVIDDLWYPGTGCKFAASAYRWIRGIVFSAEQSSDRYQYMDSLADEIPPGSMGLLFHPHLLGEWAPHWDERLKGSYLGLTVAHQPGHLIRAVLEGVAFAVKDALCELLESDVTVDTFALIGQGSRSRLWAQILSDVLAIPLEIPRYIDAVYGAALLTAVGTDCIDGGFDVVPSLIRIRDKVYPAAERVTIYEELFSVYKEADKRLQEISYKLENFLKIFN